MPSDNEEYLDSPPSSESEELEEVTELKERAYHVYYNLWGEFYAWEQSYCQTAISRLSRGSYVRPPPLPTVTNDRWENTSLAEEDTWISIEDVDPITKRRSVVDVSIEPMHPSVYKPYPRYTACTPSSRNLKMYEDVNNDKAAAFANFADDTDFDLRSYLGFKKTFQWEIEYADPDLEIIQMELVRRLCRQPENKFSLEDIDALKILPALRENSRSGLIWYSKQRDYLRWSGSPLAHQTSEGNRTSSSDELDLLETNWTISSPSEAVIEGIFCFCSKLNCLFTCCGIHPFSSHPITIPLRPNLSVDLIEKARQHDETGAICANNCYKLWQGDDLEDRKNTNWDIHDHTLFETVIKMAPDSIPCDLAIICRKPCVEVYIERVAFLSTAEPSMDRGKPPGVAREKVVFFEDTVKENGDNPKIEPAGPCYHPGACNKFADCVCFRNKQRCIRNCRCSNECELRFKGCNCHMPPGKKRKYKHKKFDCCHPSVKPTTCSCIKRNRECDPELCMGLGYSGARKHASHKATCQNMRLQKAKFVSIHIKESQHGLGAFATRRIMAGQCIGEYVGEMAKGVDLSALQQHVNLNYTYELAEGVSRSAESFILLDSWNLGNLTRYLNHCDPANCRAEVLFVAGDHRILICAERDIKSGEELTLDYGENYWIEPKKTKRFVHPEDLYDPIFIQWEDS